MARPVRTPSIPKSPGDWLACFRYRAGLLDGKRWSPERLGQLIGVSGDTVRRWENDRAMPTANDLYRIEQLCSLHPIEVAFLKEALSDAPPETEPDRTRFTRVATQLLSGDFPAYMFDSLFYVRAWNENVRILNFPHHPPHGEHIIENILQLGGPGRLAGSDLRQGQWGWLRAFWFSTAHLCGSEAYRRIIERLCRNPEFNKRWMEMALDPPDQEDRHFFAPYHLYVPRLGRFRVSTTVISVPPVYYYREYVPVDTAARECWESVFQEGPQRVSVADGIHWSHDKSSN